MKGETTEEELLSTGGCRKRGVLGAKSRNDILGRGNSICKGREAWDRMAHIAAVHPLVVYVSIPPPPTPPPPTPPPPSTQAQHLTSAGLWASLAPWAVFQATSQDTPLFDSSCFLLILSSSPERLVPWPHSHPLFDPSDLGLVFPLLGVWLPLVDSDLACWWLLWALRAGPPGYM